MKKRILLMIALILLMPTLGFVAWAETLLGPMDEALAALDTTADVRVSQERWVVFEPTAGTPTTGLIVYPGAQVDERSYAPIAHTIARQGFLVVIVPMPLNLALVAPDKADEVIAAFPQITHWAIGGHSMGGAMAVKYAADHPQAVSGLALWAAYPQASDSVADQVIAATAVFGTNDGLVSSDERELARQYLPPDAHVVLIEGGNHAQFGWYGPQDRDNPAAISREDQQRQVVAATVALLREINGP